MRPAWRDSLIVPILLVLVPAAGLLSVGVAGLWRALRTAEAQARIDASRTALSTARGIRSAAGDPRILDLLDPASRFEMRDGVVHVPEDVAWLGAPPPESPEIELPRSLRTDLAEAWRLEFEARSPDAAASAYDRILDDPFVMGRDRALATLAAAWSAHRTGAAARRDALLDRLASSPDPMYRDTFVGSLLLRAAAGLPYPADTVARFRTLSPDRARPALERLRELAPARADETLALERMLDATVARRRILHIASSHRTLLATSTAPVAQSAGEAILLFFPDPSPEASGLGAVIPAPALARALESASLDPQRAALLPAAAAIPWTSRLVFTAPPPPDAIPAIPGIAVLPELPAPAGRAPWTAPWVPLLLAVALAATLALGLTLSLRALRRERAAIALRSDFLTSVTHELKTPLASIRLLCEMLEGGLAAHSPSAPAPSPEQRDRYTRRLTAEATRLGMIVENVLDLGRIERCERAYDRRPLDPREFVRDALRVFEPLAERDDLALVASLPNAGPEPDPHAPPILGDRDALSLALLNLLENARRHGRGGTTIHVDLDLDLDVQTTAPRDAAPAVPATWRIRVRDEGPGVPEAEREAIFEKFRRGSTAAANGNPGVGLGLFLARGIARAHGGDLRCETPPAGSPGASFVLEIPAASPEEVPSP